MQPHALKLKILIIYSDIIYGGHLFMSKISNISLLIAMILHFNASNDTLALAEETDSGGPKITASGGEDCFKSLDAKDMENLGTILYLRK